MFYSQFILAKKGPLGTIWIAAHLERKLRKNQVADTDIGVSVDSILFPDVPIALRLSSHLLLGVVRIYNRKVNYLFDDCSETLLKIKQAFRSTVVDLPPEESKAPYHSITLPEKFDLDDFELPDSDIFHGNYVDHHISSREQITLQDTMEGVSYSTSKFGLDERFGDGDASGLDLDEELFLEKIGTEGHAEERADPQAFLGLTLTPNQGQQPEVRAANSEAMVDGVDEFADVMDYAQAPRTPGLMEVPNLSNAQDASACDDHLESEYHLPESTTRENTNNAPYEDKQEVDWCSQDTGSDAAPREPSNENVYLSGILEVKELMPQGQIVSIQENAPTDAVNKDQTYFLSVDGTYSNHQCPNEIGLPKSATGIYGLASIDQQDPEDVSAKDLAHLGGEGLSNLGTSNQQKLCYCGPESASENQVGFMETPETQAFQGATGKPDCVNDYSEQNLKKNQVQGHASGEDIHVATREADSLAHTMDSQDRLMENPNNSVESELPAPEKLLSVPEGHMDLHLDNMIEVSPVDIKGFDDGDTGSKTAPARKRNFNESTLTEQSLNSVESSRRVRVKQTTGSVPNDDDLLSSILVGRSSILRVKQTPLYEVTSVKRTRSAPWSGAPKRKVLVDDTMVLHGDTIRQQLTNTEDLRRVRKKAPSTLSEVSMIKKLHMEDENFLQPIFTSISVELAYLHGQVHDLSRIRFCQNEVNDSSLEIVTELKLPSPNDENDVSRETIIERNLASHSKNSGASPETKVDLHLTSTNNGNNDIEYYEGPGMTNVIEVSGQGLNNEFLPVRDNETAETSTSLLPSEKKPEEIDHMSIVSPPAIAAIEPLDFTGCATGNVGDALDGVVQTDSLNESGETNAYVNTDAAVVPNQKKTLPSFELDSADVDDREATIRNEVTQDGNAEGEGKPELGVKDDILPDMSQDTTVVELVPNADHGELQHDGQSEIYNTTTKEQREGEFSCPRPENMQQDGSVNNCDPDHTESHQPNTMNAEISGFDLLDRDAPSYLAAGNDTEFLNVDGDELTEMADDHIPDAEEALYAENTGWSSRTRAVSKYLQAAFVKEAKCGRNSLSLDNLLIGGKTCKEASRMFFETLVLKTRDYIHVEQRIPFDDITIRPRTRLMKPDF